MHATNKKIEEGQIAKFWREVSLLGIHGDRSSGMDIKPYVLSNRINIILSVIGILSFLLLVLFSPVKFSQFNANEYRLLITAGVAVINLILSRAGANNLGRISLIFLPVFFLTIYPVLFGVVNDETFLNEPWLIITASLLPHFILPARNNKVLYIISILYFLFLLIPYEQVLFRYINPEVHILGIVQKNFLYIKMAQLGIYLFLNLSVMYMLSVNRQHGEELELANEQLREQSEIITGQSEELGLQNAALESKNEALVRAIGELKEAQSQLVQAEKMATIGTLTAGIAHEINNPVNYITSGVEGLKVSLDEFSSLFTNMIFLLEKPGADARQVLEEIKQKYDTSELFLSIPILVDNIRKGSDRASEIIRSLLFFTRSSDEKMVLSDIRESIEATLIILGNQIKNRIILEKNYGELPNILCYPGKINQVFMNLLTNAAQAIEGEGRITITTSFDSVNEKVTISIGDSGMGISEENRDRIFDPFFTTKEAGKGTGLGLPMVMKIMQEHHGDIRFTSVPAKGSTFIIALPVNPVPIENNDSI